MFTDCNNYNEERRERELITAVVVIRVSPSRKRERERSIVKTFRGGIMEITETLKCPIVTCNEGN